MAKLTAKQQAAVTAAHDLIDTLTVVPPGTPDTPAAREARRLRTDLEECFPEAFPKPSPIVTAGA